MTEAEKETVRAKPAEIDDVEETTGRERALRVFGLAALLIIATLVAYQQAWRAGFIWDDDMYVTTNHLLTAPDGLKKIWFSLESPSQYFPLVYTSFRFEHLLWGLNPVGYHWINFLLHAANALLLWRVLANLRIPGAWLAAALFALHPVQVESVAWISERKNVLMAFFYLLAVLAWVKFVAGKHKDELKFYLLAFLCFLLALFSKTTACTLPIALLLISWLKRGSISLQRIVQLVPFLAAGVGMGLVSMWWERYHQGTQGEVFSIGIIERLLVAARALWFYLIKLAWPAQLAFSYPRWDIATKDLTAYYWLGGCLLLVAAIWVLRRWLGRGPEVALAFFAITLAPVLGFVMLYTFRYTFVADHYVYIASIGPLTLAAAAITTALNPLPRIARQSLIVLLAAALLIPLAFRTWQHSAAFANEEALWRDTLKVNPGSWMVHNNLAILLVRQGKTDEAMGEYEEALRLDPDYAEAHYNLATALMRHGRFSEARMHFEKAIELNPKMAVARANLGAALLEQGETEKAIEQFQEALKTDPRLSLAREQLAQALLFLGRKEEALPQLESAAAGNDDSFEVHNKITSLL
ncbi:MAG: tetratricopeptide repeat protein, partial [Terriglobales bacterium]